MLTNRKYSGRRPLVVVAALLSLMILLPLAGCKNDTVSEPTRYTVKFDKNAEDATGEMASQTFTDGIAQKLTANGFSRPDYGFAGWAESAEGTVKYSDREEITVTKDITLYAKWTPVYTVTFDKNAKDATGEMASQTFTDGVKQELSANQFKRDTWTFIGWSEDKIASAATWEDKAKFMATKDTTLYAVWRDNGTVAPVTFTPDNGTKFYFDEPLSVTLATTEDGATIQYKLDDGKWQDYTVGTPISVTTSTTITAQATKAGLKDSTETKATYTVRQLSSITVIPPTKTVYSVGDTFDITSMKVTATYDDETRREVTESATTDFDSKSAGVKTVTVSYSEDGITKDGSFKVGVIGEATYQFTETVQDVDSTYTGTMSGGTYKKFGDWPQTVMGSDVMVGEKKITRGGLDFYVGTDGNYYVKQGDKYYKVEPIVWRVLNKDYNSTGNALLLAERSLTGGVYYVDRAQRTIGSQTVYANNYQYSTVRAWLNGKYESGDTQAKDYTDTGFLQTAFTQSAQNLIATTTVDNSAASTNPASNDKQWSSGTNNYACADTTDKIFLLSEKEATTDTYGFDAYNKSDSTRIRVNTDYANATGAYQFSMKSRWWLRSPYYDDEIYAQHISEEGYTNICINYVNGKYCVVPALCVQLQ